jgi:hypothetical protein
MTTTDTAELTRPSALLIRARENFHVTRNFSKFDRERERNWYGQKWFDYRFISPTEATARFRLVYQNVYRWKYSTSIDTLEAEKKTGVSIKETPGEMTSLWRARQFADELGVTYEIFLEAAFEFCIRRGWSRLPHMNQLYGDKNRDAIAIAVKSFWADHIGSRLIISTLPEYREESYLGLQGQIDHRDWVLDQIEARHGSPLSIGRACYVHRVLPEEIAFLAFGQERLDQAKAEIEFGGLIPDEHCIAELHRPCCYGLPGAPDAGKDVCDKCPAIRSCLRIEAKVRAIVLETFKCYDPVDYRRKALRRRRTKKFRAIRARILDIEKAKSS